MKMLTDQQIDYHAARVIANDHDWQEHLSVIIAQAKLANELQAKLVKARSDALEAAAKHFELTHRELWTPQIADELRALKEKA